ncbi:MAG: response regulator [Dehalococcoidia bacterium]|nr:response regulator [Dehalococcoidia bacterium]
MTKGVISPAKTEIRRATVLVVDDARFQRMRSVRLLTENGFHVVEALNGIEAIKRYKEEKPDAVIMDITMPEMDGLATLKELIKLDTDAKVCIVTAMGQQSIVMEAIHAGAKDFVVKPCSDDRVLAAVRKMIGQGELLQKGQVQAAQE